jgi:tRNA A-37 threonylcarbamoyl transferase component Bud32
VTFEASGLCWTAEGACAKFLERDVARRLDGLAEAPESTLIKRNLVRTVLRLALTPPPDGLGPVIVKRYEIRGAWDWLKYWIRPSRAAAEWSAGRALAAAGVPTAVPIAKAERRRLVLRDAALVVPEIRDALRLDEFADRLSHSEPDPLREALFAELARIVRRMHDAGIVHRDLHAGNVLVAGPAGAPRIHLIDLHSVRVRATASRRQQRADLTKLLLSLRRHSTPEERRGVLAAYEAMGPRGSVAAELLGDGPGDGGLEARLSAREAKRFRSRTKRCLVRSSKFTISQTREFRLHHLRSLPADEVVALVRAHCEALGGDAGKIHEQGEHPTITRHTMNVGAASRSLVVKGYAIEGPSEALWSLVRHPRPIAAWLAGNGLLVRGIAVAEPLALVLRRFGPFVRDAYLVRVDLGAECRSDRIARSCARNPGLTERAEKRALVAATGRFVRSLHAADIHHPGLKAENLFVRRGPGEVPEIVVADCDGVEFDRPVSPGMRVENLAQLSASAPPSVSLTDRLRFFREYAGDDAALRADWKDWFRAVARECQNARTRPGAS